LGYDLPDLIVECAYFVRTFNNQIRESSTQCTTRLEMTGGSVIPFYDFYLGGLALIADYIRSPIELAPPEQHVSLLVRHSIRVPINVPEETWLARLTPAGIQLAEEYGAWLAQRRHPYRVMTSPVGRCVETSRSIIRGGNWPNPVVIDQKLGFPFIERG
jgi:hypothetical protein